MKAQVGAMLFAALLILIGGSEAAFGKDMTVSGKVRFQSQLARGARVDIINSESKTVIATVYANDKGRYSKSLAASTNRLAVTAHYEGFSSQVIGFSHGENGRVEVNCFIDPLHTDQPTDGSLDEDLDRIPLSRQRHDEKEIGKILDLSGDLDLTSADGKSVRAKILGYDENSDNALIEREDGKRYKLKADTFCEKDQHILRSWNGIGAYLDPSRLNISVSSSSVTLQEVIYESNEGPVNTCYFEAYPFGVEFENRTTNTLDNISVEVVAFVNVEELNEKSDQDTHTKIACNAQVYDIGTVGARSTETLTRNFFTGYECVVGRSGSEKVYKQIVEIKGFWVRVNTLLPDGTRAVIREFREPANLWDGIEWQDATEAMDLKNGRKIISNDEAWGR